MFHLSKTDALDKLPTLVGYILCPESDHSLLAYLIENGELEYGTRLVIQKFLTPGNTFVDIGANIGMHTLAAAKSLRGKGKIIAFEPYEPIAALLSRTIAINDFTALVTVCKAAISDRSGEQNLYLGSTCGHHSLLPLNSEDDTENQATLVSTMRLDQVIDINDRVDLIKIDVEGTELDVLEGATAIIQHNKNIGLIVEFGFSHLVRSGITREEWF